MKRKGKKSIISIPRTMLYTEKINFRMQIFFKKGLFEYKNQFAVEKENTKKFLGAISKKLKKILSSPSKKC